MNHFVRPDPGPSYNRITRFQAECDADLADVRACKEIIRNALLMALSECRTKSRELEVVRREKLMDQLTKFFHPDADGQVDSFSDCFADIENELKDAGALS